MKQFLIGFFASIGFLSALVAHGEEPKPLLVPDYNRDGKIDAADYERLAAGEAFTVWLNDDDDAEGTDDGAEAGDTNTDLHDVPGGNDDKDFADDKVNGRCDLLDFFPVLVDVNGVEGSGDYDWKLVSPSVNVVFTQLKADTAGDFHTKETKALDDETPLYEAEVKKLAGEDGEEEAVELPAGFLKNGRGVIIVEGAAIGEGLTLRGEKNGSDPVEVTLKLSVKNVESLYGWLNLRNPTPPIPQSPNPPIPQSPNHPITQSLNHPITQRHFILVHGYNTNHDEARGNAAEFYKKLWQSGSDAMMTAVEWRGDQSQIKFELLGVNFSPNYHVNVENAFLAARPFADACKKLPGEKILVAHSLGNVLVSSAIKDYGLDYTKYVMLNAAVPREAYDAGAYDEDMVDVDWLDTNERPLLDRASQWYRNFAGKEYDPYEYRRKLAWRGRFANLPRTVNYYSPTDNILLNPDPNDPDPDKMFDRNDPEIYNKVRALLVAKLVNGRSIGRDGRKKTGFGFWSFSEKMKGTWLLDTVNDVLTNVLDVAQADAYKCEGGWGENDDYEEKDVFDPANTRFTPFLDERMKVRGMLDILPAETERLRAQHLADAIPAESFAAGANEVATVENVNEESFIGWNPDWPLYEGEDGEGTRTNLWNHSAFREVAFYHTSKFYASLAAVGKPRIIIDTDLGSSMDDLFAVDLAARMHKAGKLDLMAVMMDRPDHSEDKAFEGEFLTFADRYLASLGLGDLPIGTAMGQSKQGQTVFNPYWTLIYSNNVTGVGLLLPTNRTPEQIASLTNAVALYRRLLNGAPDRSVVVCSTGFLTNLEELMKSGEDYEKDGSINVSGMDLIAAKVKELRIMGGCFDYTVAPDGTDGAEYNFAGDPAAAKLVVEGWPTPVILSTWEVGLKLEYKPKDVLADFPAGTFDPVVRAAYTYWPEPLRPGDRNRLWDPMTVLPLTEGETLVPLSEMGGISVDGKGKTTFTPDASSNRCYQVASNMNAAAVMNRYRAICRTGNPSVSVVPISLAEAGVDYNGSVLSVKIDGFNPGSFYTKEDLFATLTVAGETYDNPEWTDYDELSGIVTLEFTVPADKVTAGNAYEGEVKVGFRNETLGENVVYTRKREFFVQGRQEKAGPETGWFHETDLALPTNYVPKTAMPERCLATVETTVLFTGQTFTVEYQTATNAVQGAVRIVGDGKDGYKFQYYACVGKTNEDSFVRGWWDFNAGGEDVSEVKPVLNKEYTVRAEAYYFEDARGEENTLVIWVEEVGSNRGSVKQFVGNLVNANGGVGGTTRLNSVGLQGEGSVASLTGNYYTNTVNATLAKIDGDREYATVADAVAAVGEGQAVRLLHAASWKPTEADIDKSVKFLNKSCLVLDLSGLPANAQAVWTDVDGNDGTLTVKLVYADTVVYGTIRTAETTDYVEGAIAVKDGKYVYVGDEAGVAAFIEDGVTEVIDHRGKGMVMPGCTDGHSHYLNTFAMNNMKGGILFDLGDNKAAVMQKLETAALAASGAGKKSLCGFGWNSQIILTNKLSLTELDEITFGVSAVIYDSSGHHAFCNSECLKRCKILSEDGKTVLIKEIDGGVLELDDKGYPTGYVNERVTGYLTRMGGIDPDELIDDAVAEVAIRKSQELLLSTGYTSAMDAWSNNLHPSNLYVVANRMDASGDLKFALSMTYEVEPWQTDEAISNEIKRLDSLRATYGTEHVRPEYLKVFMDGVVEARTGATFKPYKKDETHPEKYYYKSFWSTNRLAEITANCNAWGLTVHTHTMGDAAIRETVDAYVKANELRNDNTQRNCLVHLRNVSTNAVNDFQRMAENNIACAAGPTWHTMDTEFAGMLKQFLDDEYVDHAYPIKSFFDAGIKVSSHSDYPANKPSPQDPFGMMHVAVNGMVPDPGEKDYPFDTDELVTVEQAFQALTLNGAWQLGLEDERGSIAVGKWADFVLADQDVFTCAATDIGKTKVVSTWFEGEMVYPIRGSEENPWQIGATTNDTVTAWTNGTTLVVEGRGAMKGFETVGSWGTGIAAVDFGAQVTNFGANAFAGCAALKTLVMRGNPPALGGNHLSGATVIVREDALAKFKAADGWKDLVYGKAMEVCYDYANVKKLAPFLHEVWYDDYTFDEKGETLAGVESFSCSSVRNGNFIGRNFDFFLDDKPEFVVHVAANPAKGRLASVAMAMHTGMREDGVTNGQYTTSYDLIPNRTLDGINECGVAINQNVVAYDPEVAAGVEREFTGTNPGAPDLNSSFVTRMVLDRATNAAHAVELIKAHNVFGISVSGDILHYMISDSKETYVVEIVTNTVVARHFTMMTNFAINWDNEHARALTDADNEKWTREYYPEPSNIVIAAGNFVEATNRLAKYYAQHAEGVERFVRLRDNYAEGATFEGMFDLMRRAQYSQASSTNTLPYWYSDRCSVALDKELVEAGYPELANTYMLYGLKYYPDELGVSGFDLDLFMETNLLERERFYLADKDRYRKADTGTWLTVHNTTYDISKRMFRVAVQEDYEHTFDICLTPGSERTPWVVGKGVEAWTNGTELVIQGAGTITDLAAILAVVKGGIAAITITEATVTGAAKDVFAGFGGKNPIALTLPNGWQGELPDEKGNWYGATGVELTGDYPLAVKNVTFLQRYPWNGLVDVSCDLTGAGTVTLGVTVLTNDVKFITNPTIIGETTVDLDAAGGVTNGVRFIWNAAEDLPAGFKASGVKVKVTVMQ